MSDEEFEGGSDQEVSKHHSKLIDAVTQLDKGQRVRKAERSEPSLEVSEFHLVKSGVSHGNAVHLGELAKTLGRRATHAEIGRKLKTVEKKSRTLRKPLEKPAAARIKRAVGFENVRNELGKWDAIVQKNRTAERLSFPLKQSDMRLETSNEFLKRFKVQSELEIALAALEPKKEEKKTEEKDETPMSLEKIMERRRDTAKFRAQQSYREAKAHRQNKIKSKKFHRIERKQKIKAQLKEFEELQKTDPEAALAKLELLEKSRAEERMSLRHKSTGQWAKNQQVRAKYDKESRKVLAQQLSISRELTQKVQDEEDDEEEEDSVVKPLSKGDKENPWTNGSKNQSEIDEFISSYRKYWDAKNEQKIAEGIKVNGEKEVAETFVVPEIKDLPTNLNPVEQVIVEHPELMFDDDSEEDLNVEEEPAAKRKRKEIADTSPAKSSVKKRRQPQTSEKKQKKKSRPLESVGTSVWLVTPLPDNGETRDESAVEKYTEIDDIFDAITVKSSEKFSKKLANMKNGAIEGKSKRIVDRKKKSEEYAPDLSFKNQKQRPIIDEQMVESTDKSNSEINDDVIKLRKLSSGETRLATKSAEAEIDPNKFINIKPKYLKTKIPDLVTGGDEGLDDSEEEEEEKHKLISEAFADDDVVEEFRREKSEEANKSKPENLELGLPGWGSWGGKNVGLSGRKKRRFILKFPKDAARKDENKGDVIIIEEKDPKIKEHQVNELPFPFNSVKDFEASVRAPIGRTFIPENAHRKLIQPTVDTKLGKIIEPMDQESLVNIKNTNNDRKKYYSKKRDRKTKKK